MSSTNTSGTAARDQNEPFWVPQLGLISLPLGQAPQGKGKSPPSQARHGGKEPKALQWPHSSPGTEAEPHGFPCQGSHQLEQSTGSALWTGAAPRKSSSLLIIQALIFPSPTHLSDEAHHLLLPDLHVFSVGSCLHWAFDTGFAQPKSHLVWCHHGPAGGFGTCYTDSKDWF